MGYQPNLAQSSVTPNATQSVQTQNFSQSRMQKQGQSSQTIANNHRTTNLDPTNTVGARHSKNHQYIKNNR